MNSETTEYAGFWVRVLAGVIDAVLLLLITLPLLVLIYGWEYFDAAQTQLVVGLADALISWVAPAIVVIAFWLYKQGTPGKLAFSVRVVDARTLSTLTPTQATGRYLAYVVSLLPLCLGIFWVAFDSKKQGWHDKLAGTVVIRGRKLEPISITSENPI